MLLLRSSCSPPLASAEEWGANLGSVGLGSLLTSRHAVSRCSTASRPPLHSSPTCPLPPAWGCSSGHRPFGVLPETSAHGFLSATLLGAPLFPATSDQVWSALRGNAEGRAHPTAPSRGDDGFAGGEAEAGEGVAVAEPGVPPLPPPVRGECRGRRRGSVGGADGRVTDNLGPWFGGDARSLRDWTRGSALRLSSRLGLSRCWCRCGGRGLRCWCWCWPSVASPAKVHGPFAATAGGALRAPPDGEG